MHTSTNPIDGPNDTAQATGISDNPLDAPDAPRPQQAQADVEDDDKEDEDMEDIEDGEMGDENEIEDEEEIENENENENENGESDKESAEEEITPERPAQTKAAMEQTARSNLIQQTHMVIVPSFSAWFDMQKIHKHEKKGLPEFFNCRNRSKTPSVYKDYRYFMINTYRVNPVEYLSVTSCRRNLAGDVGAISRVHCFLETWGLINYQVDPMARPSAFGPPFTGHFHVVLDTPRGLYPQMVPGSTTTAGKPLRATERAMATVSASYDDLNLDTRREIYDANGPLTEAGHKGDSKASAANGVGGTNGTQTLQEKVQEKRKQVLCDSCRVDCTRVRYHNVKLSARSHFGSRSADICPNCYLELRFPNNTNSSDFVRIDDPTYGAQAGYYSSWTQQEVLLLLEALEIANDNWTSVAEHVGRTREECITKFLSLPMVDMYRELDGAPPENFRNKDYVLFEREDGERVPISAAENPGMSLIAALTGTMDRESAAGVVGRTPAELQDLLRRQVQDGSSSSAGLVNGGGANNANTNAVNTDAAAGTNITTTDEAAVKRNDSMDIDDPEDEDDSEDEEEDEEEGADSLSVKSPSQPNTNTSTALITTTTNTFNSMALNDDNSAERETNSLLQAAFRIAGIRASIFFPHEERGMIRLVMHGVSTILSKHDQKLSQFLDLERVLLSEKREIERTRERLYLDRLAFKDVIGEVHASFHEAQNTFKEKVDGIWNRSAQRFGAGGGGGFRGSGVGSRGMDMDGADDAMMIDGGNDTDAAAGGQDSNWVINELQELEKAVTAKFIANERLGMESVRGGAGGDGEANTGGLLTGSGEGGMAGGEGRAEKSMDM
ncbi:MAG: hypothetical protein M1823_001504 [Watsoniomyces obsoletus]|nr:MAG: hypothetical protein M1823_001504 [Watsoniomyces obsoletus]